MVVDLLDDAVRTDEVFHALADATRRDIVARTLQAEQSVSTLARSYPMSFAAVQKHVAVLERARLVRKRPNGREQLVGADIDTILAAARVLDSLERLWVGRLQRFGELLAESEPDDKES